MKIRKCKVINTNLGDQVVVSVNEFWFRCELTITLVGSSYTESCRGDLSLLEGLFDVYDGNCAACFVARKKRIDAFMKS